MLDDQKIMDTKNQRIVTQSLITGSVTVVLDLAKSDLWGPGCPILGPGVMKS